MNKVSSMITGLRKSPINDTERNRFQTESRKFPRWRDIVENPERPRLLELPRKSNEELQK